MEAMKKQDQNVQPEEVQEDNLEINPLAMIKPIAVSADLMAEMENLTDEEKSRFSAHIKQCADKGLTPIPPSQWVSCPLCKYRTPNSLISHIKAKHDGLIAAAAELSRRITAKTGEPTTVLPEQINLVSPALSERFKEAGAKGEPAKKAKKAAEAAAAGTTAPAGTENAEDPNTVNLEGVEDEILGGGEKVDI